MAVNTTFSMPEYSIYSIRLLRNSKSSHAWISMTRTSNKDNLGLEMIWKASEALKELDLFTGMLYNHYSAPPGFCFDPR